MDWTLLLIIVVVAITCYLIGVADGARRVARLLRSDLEAIENFEKPRILIYVRKQEDQTLPEDTRIH